MVSEEGSDFDSIGNICNNALIAVKLAPPLGGGVGVVPEEGLGW